MVWRSVKWLVKKRGARWGLAFLAVLIAYRIYAFVICDMAWQATGYTSKYSMTAGCLIQQSSGKWLPEDKVRPE